MIFKPNTVNSLAQPNFRANIPLHYTFLLYPAVVLMPIQDCAWRGGPAGYFGAAPAGFLFIPYIVADIFWQSRTIQAAMLRDYYTKLSLVMGLLLLGVVTGFVWIALQNNPAELLQQYGYKGFTTAVLMSGVIYPAILPPRETRGLAIAVFLSALIVLLGYILSDTLKSSGFLFPSFFHYSRAITTPRGFSLELSTFGATSTATVLLLAALIKQPTLKIGLTLIGLAVAILTGSKGAMVVGAACIGYLLVFHPRLPAALKIVAIAMMPLLAAPAIESFIQRLSFEHATYSSIGTRSVYAGMAITHVISHPLGVGFSGFVPFFSNITETLASLAAQFGLSGGQISEAWRYAISNSAYNAGTKTFLGDAAVIWGALGLIALALYLFAPLRRMWKSSDPVQAVTFLFSAMSLLFFVSGQTLYILPLAVGITRKSLLERQS